jgi:hypothetical protein
MFSNAQTFTIEQAKNIFTTLAQEKIITRSFKNQIVTLIDEKNWDVLHFIETINFAPEERLGEILIVGARTSFNTPTFTKNGILRICLDNYRKKGEKDRGGWVVYPPLSSLPETIPVNQTIQQKDPRKKPNILKLLNALKKIQLIDNQVYNEVLGVDFRTTTDFIRLIIERNDFYEYYPIVKQAQLKILADLRKNEIVSEINYQKYINSYQNYALHNWADILKDCKNALVIDYQNFPQKPLDFYSLLYQKVKEILPEFDYKDLKIKGKKINDDYRYVDYVSIKIQEAEYQQFITDNIYYLPVPDNQLIRHNHRENELELVNDFLRDRGDLRRFYWVKPFYFPQHLDPPKVGLILLDSSQTNIFGELISPQPDQLNYSHFFAKNFTRKHLKEKIDTYISKNIITQLSNNEIDSVITEIIRNKPEYLFNHLPFPIFQPRIPDSWEMDSDSLDQLSFHETIKQNFAGIDRLTKGLIKIQDYKLEKKAGFLGIDSIANNTDINSFVYSLIIKCLDKSYSFDSQGFEIFNRLPQFFNQLLKEQNSKLQLYLLDDWQWLLLSDEQLNYFRQTEPEIFKYLKE